MRRLVRVAVWVLVLTACAAVGAFIASRSNPFPPGVDDPGAAGQEPSGTSTVTWSGGGTVRSVHRLFVGGSCRTTWRVRISFDVADERVRGAGTARLVEDAVCDFTTAQVQARRILFDVAGEELGSSLKLRFEERGVEPDGAIDLGGLSALLTRVRPGFEPTGDRWSGVVTAQASDGDRGRYEARGRIRLSATRRS